MTLSLVFAFLWLILANLLGMLPSKDNHWRRAYCLIGFGIPLLGFVVHENGIVIGLVFLVAGASILRWPVIYLWRWSKRPFGVKYD